MKCTFGQSSASFRLFSSVYGAALKVTSAEIVDSVPGWAHQNGAGRQLLRSP
jgi:hypothetical protein